MPLLCISLLALLLLPLSLSCDSKRPPEDIQDDYMAIVQTDLDNTRERNTALLHNSSCPELNLKLRRCTPSITNVVSNLHILTCKMKNLSLSHTDRLVSSVLNSVRCACPEKPTQEPSRNLRRRSTRHRRNNQSKRRSDTKKLCKAMVILYTMTECYEMLNSLLVQP